MQNTSVLCVNGSMFSSHTQEIEKKTWKFIHTGNDMTSKEKWNRNVMKSDHTLRVPQCSLAINNVHSYQKTHAILYDSHGVFLILVFPGWIWSCSAIRSEGLVTKNTKYVKCQYIHVRYITRHTPWKINGTTVYDIKKTNTWTSKIISLHLNV